MYKNILVPVDGSDTATLGLREAIQLARDGGARIRLVHVVNELIMLSADAYGANIGSVLDIIHKGGKALLESAELTVRDAGVKVDTSLVEAVGGHAGEHIVEAAMSWPAQVIVCGTHGRRGLRRMVLGSDAEYIVRHTPVPVLLVRNPAPGRD